MSITGEPGRGPMRVGIPIADLSGGLFCALGILVALLEREQSGKGQAVASSLLQAQIFMLDFQAARWLNEGEVPGQAGNNHPTSIPTGVFKTKDGHINIATAGSTMWQRLCRAIGARGPARASRLRDGGGALQEPQCAERRDRGLSRQRHQRRMGGAHERGRGARAGRSMPWTRCSPTRRSSTSAWSAMSRRRTSAARCTCSTSPCRCRARRAGWSARRPSAASTPRRCCASSASARPTIAELRKTKVI